MGREECWVIGIWNVFIFIFKFIFILVCIWGGEGGGNGMGRTEGEEGRKEKWCGVSTQCASNGRNLDRPP